MREVVALAILALTAAAAIVLIRGWENPTRPCDEALVTLKQVEATAIADGRVGQSFMEMWNPAEDATRYACRDQPGRVPDSGMRGL